MNPRRKAVITGASSGIGRATAIRFASDGYDVCINARRVGRLEELLRSLPTGNHLVCAGDYSDPQTTERMSSQLKESWRRVDVLVNCAGIGKSAHVTDSPIEQWRQPFDTMVEGAVRTTRACVA